MFSPEETSLVPTSARWLITLTTIAYGFGPLLIDMNRTHLLHPAWPPHARFHLMWATVAQVGLAVLGLTLVWRAGPDPLWRCELALWLAAAHVAGFFVAWLLARVYGGALRDPGGMPLIAGTDGNAVACIAMAAMLLVAAWQLAGVS